jgi:hypothetical protein
MSQFGTSDHQTYTVTGSQALGRPDGRVAIRLLTKELGYMAFEVDQRAINALRNDLAAAEIASSVRWEKAVRRPALRVRL